MLVADADKVTPPDPHRLLLVRVSTGVAAFTVTTTAVRVVDSQLAVDVAVAWYVPDTSWVDVASTLPPELTSYHFMLVFTVPVATKLDTVDPAQNVCAEAVGAAVLNTVAVTVFLAVVPQLFTALGYTKVFCPPTVPVILPVVYVVPVPRRLPPELAEYQLMVPLFVALPVSVTVPDPQRLEFDVVNTGTPAKTFPDKLTTTDVPLGVDKVIVPVTEPLNPDFSRTKMVPFVTTPFVGVSAILVN